MKIVALSVVRNEVDILEAFVRYHLEIVDHVIVADHRSIDGSAELLGELESEGLPLSLRPLSAPLLNRRQALTDLMWETAEALRPDLVLLLDADEFVARDGPEPVRTALESLTKTAPTAIPRRTYVPTLVDDQAEPNPIGRIVHRREPESRQRYKVAVPGRFAGDREYGLSTDGHRLVLWASRAEVAAVTEPGLYLAHYPVRSVEQLTAKLIGLCAGRVAGGGTVPETSLDERKLVVQLSLKGDPSPEWLRDVALSFDARHDVDGVPSLVQDPLEPVPGLRYTSVAGMSTLGLLAGTIEDVAEVMGATRATSPERTAATLVERIQALEDQLSRLEGGPDGPKPASETALPAPARRGKRARRDTLARSQRRVRALEAELEELRESKSWKLTAPLRSLGSLGRSSGKR